MRRPTAFVASVVIAALCVSTRASQEQPTFRSGTHVVEVDVRVFDRSGRFVADLTKDDFELVEAGAPQQVQALFLVAGTTAAAAPGAAPETADPSATPAPPPASARQTWIFVFDLNHLTPGAGFDRARKAVEDYIRDRWKEGDLAGVVAGSKMVNNRLTSVREELVGAVKGIKPLVETRNRSNELTRMWPKILNEDEAVRIAREEREALRRAIMRACSEDPDACRQIPPDLQLTEKARRFVRESQRATMETLTALNALASGLARVPGPKTIVFLTDGFVTAEIETTLRSVVGQMARAGGRVYSIDVRGLNRGRGAGIIDQGTATDEAGAPAQFDASEDGPNSLAVDTGGMMIRNENNIGRALETITQDSGQYYVLGYTPTDTNFDGKFRPIEVRVKRPGVRVRARRGYLALEPAKMLVPQPIKAGDQLGRRLVRRSAQREGGGAEREGGGAGSSADLSAVARSAKVEAPEPPAAAEPPAATATGTIVNAPPVLSAAGPLRIRPDAELTVKELAGADTAAAGDFAARGWDAYQRGDVESAARSFSEAAAQPGVRPWVLYALGLSQVALARPAEAIGSWERVRRAVPEFEPVYVDLADTYLQVSDLTSALAVLRDAEQRWPADPEIRNAIGVIHVRRGALDEAIAAFTTATEIARDDALGYFNLGRAYEMRFQRGQRYISSQRRWVSPDDDRRKAEENYQRAVKLGGPFAEAAAEGYGRLQWSKK